ncbi:MAG: nodulation protein NfeD [Chloroflexi bacterium]|nr:nodulation protein NfeD [Chloroflexota bacterium]
MNANRKARIAISLSAAILGLVLLLVAPAAAQAPGKVGVLNVKGAITPVVLSYLNRGLRYAQDGNVSLLVIQLDTPGGSVEIMKSLTDDMIRSSVPIAVWVGPEGARAASAGTFVVLAAHVAAMAPGTTIGAASVVSMQGQELDETSKAKVTNDLTARIRNFTQRRGAQAQDWAERTVTEAIAATADEVYKLGVIDYIAPTIPDLLRQMDGMTVRVAGRDTVLRTADLPVQNLPMTLPEQFLHLITDPNIAFILLTLGLNGLLFELSSPGGFAAGIIGGICLVLGLYALGVLSVNWTGLLFIVLAFVLFIVDIKAATHGVLTVGGIASFVFGALILFSSPVYTISRALVISVAGGTGAFFAFAVSKALLAQKRKPSTGREAIIGMRAVVRIPLEPDGMVMLAGELWKARAEEGVIDAGQTVEVVGLEGFTVIVRAVQPES